MTNYIARVLWIASLALAVPLRAQDSVITLAGQALMMGGTNGTGTNALFGDPAAIVADASGNVFVADSQNHAIRRISTNGVVSTFAGQLGTPGSSNGTGTQAQFDTPSGIAMDQSGNFFVSDTGNHTIRKISPAGVVSTIAGLAEQSGFTNGIGAAARFNSPLGLAVALSGTVYVADCGNHLIRAILPGNVVTTLAGGPENWGSDDGIGGDARFNGPVGLSLNAEGNLFVSDSNNHTIRRITPNGSVTTWAGVPGGDGCVNGDRLTARFSKPAELAIDQKNNLFVADSFNHVIRKISSNGNVTTVTGAAGSRGSADGINGQARFFNPYGLAVAPDGSLMVADVYNELLRVVLVPFSVAIQSSSGSGMATLSWDCVAGRRYQVQYQDQDAIDSGAWLSLGSSITATDLSTTQIDNAFGHMPQRIYRVIIVQ